MEVVLKDEMIVNRMSDPSFIPPTMATYNTFLTRSLHDEHADTDPATNHAANHPSRPPPPRGTSSTRSVSRGTSQTRELGSAECSSTWNLCLSHSSTAPHSRRWTSASSVGCCHRGRWVF